MFVLTDVLSETLPQLCHQIMIDLAALMMKAVSGTFPETEVQGVGHRCSHPQEAAFQRKEADNASLWALPPIYKNA